MSKPSKHNPVHRRPMASLEQTSITPLHLQNQFVKLYDARRLTEALRLAEKFTQRYKHCSFAWKALGTTLLESGNPEQARESLAQAQQLNPQDIEIYNALAKVAHKQGHADKAVEHLKSALQLDPDSEQARFMLTKFLLDSARYDEALSHIDLALEHKPADKTLKTRKAHALVQSGRFNQGLAIYEEIHAAHPEDGVTLSNLGNMYRGIGRFEEAEAAFEKACKADPRRVEYYSNYLMAMHYNPAHSADRIFQAHRKWDDLFKPKNVARATAKDISPNRRLRIGMISAGFRIHPVGQMITSSVEMLPRAAFELFAYTMSDQVDPLTERMRARVDHWQSVTHLNDRELAQRIRNDQIDILLDLCGHTEGNRLLTLAQEPAPLQVKWVGGQINTTGLSAMDYMLSDTVETPPSVDDHYTEKLIRLPDDYVCYMPRANAPDIGALPAYHNGYVTFGCFNNPSKINNVIIEHWSSILKRVPDSQLFLKGNQYGTKEFVERICKEFAAHGIARQRLLFEGYSPHYQLLNTYNRVDIALDPWPYSGGLTTCEALFMGVPVITYPGPTFAGRHSATHLTHAGLPELVADSWERYEHLAVELASDLGNLSIIRRQLRQQLTSSPVCDYQRFSRHLSTALRAIWQRYSEGKAPAALTLDKEGRAWFEGDSQPMRLHHPTSEPKEREEGFSFAFEGKIITLDHGAALVGTTDFTSLQRLGAFASIVFDPASKATHVGQQQQLGELHHYPHVVLGDGQEATLFACLDPAMSATLAPLPAEHQLPGNEQATQVIAKLPITTLRLDDIEGLESIDWLLLDNMNDSLKILENGEKALTNTLLVQARVSFTPTHERQPELAQISHWLSRHGFNLYRLNSLEHYSQLPKHSDLLKHQATQLTRADAIFIPNAKRIAKLTDNQKLKLAFLLHTVYGIHDMTNNLLTLVSQEKSNDYLIAMGFLNKPLETTTVSKKQPEKTIKPEPEPEPEPGLSLPEAPFMSEAERALFKKALEATTHYFEFGSGGSTVWAVQEGLTVKGVESDAKWVNALKTKLGERCQIEVVNIGPTGDWGYPLSATHSAKFPEYSRAIYQHEMPFDLILVDGRFRVACTIATIQHILDHHKNPEDVRIFIHDFWDRSQYHTVLNFLEVVDRAETAGLFKVKNNLARPVLDKTWQKYAKQPA